jgi:hypothetical protein
VLLVVKEKAKTVTLYTSRDSSVVIALGYGLDDQGFESRQRLGIFFFTIASRTALEPTQYPIQCVPGTFSLRIKRPERRNEAVVLAVCT